MVTPSKQEDFWFKEQELKDKKEREIMAKLLASEQERIARRQSHFMKCSHCGGDMEERTQAGLKVKGCNDCKGVWLDEAALETLSKQVKGTGPLNFLRGRQ